MSVQSGLDKLVSVDFEPLQGKRVAVLAHQPSIDRQFRHIINLFQQAPNVELVRIFAPEHGLFGTEQDQIGLDRGERRERVPVVNLYGDSFESLWPETSDFEGVDLLVADIQDVGSRYYTYFNTLAFCMQRAKEVGVAVMVLDRPNPIGSLQQEGPVLEDAMRSFVGYFPIPVRHGLTVGELATLANDEFGIGAELQVLTMSGYRRNMYFDETGLPWVLPSPNMPTLDTALVYPGGCLLEGTNLSEGRGTTRPFELFGAPGLNASELLKRMNAETLPGVAFRETAFIPTFHKFSGQTCRGLQVHVTDRNTFLPWLTYTLILRHAREIWSDFDWRRETYEFVSDRLAIDLLFGNSELRVAIERGEKQAYFREYGMEAAGAFKDLCRHVRLY